MTDADTLPYRPCVGVVLFNAAGQVFVARRTDTPDAWQMPQGGIDPGEDPQAAAFRELSEETGVTSAEMVAEIPEWLTYDLPPSLIGKVWGGRFRGQKQRWFALHFHGNDDEIDINGDHAEFDDWGWVAPERVPDLIVPFKRAVYEQVIEALGPPIRRYLGQ